MAVNPYLIFNGNCREAVSYYADVFQTEPPQILTFGNAPADPNFTLPEAAKDLVMHTQLNICGSMVWFSDTFPGTPYTLGNHMNLAIVHNDLADIKAFFHKLKEDGKVHMELQETSWSKCYGSLTDKFGIEWQLSYENGEMEA